MTAAAREAPSPPSLQVDADGDRNPVPFETAVTDQPS
jgi:hypothetical protein